MKKITLLLLLLLLTSISGYSQFTPITEGFENTTGPDTTPTPAWTLDTGDWAVFDNGVGTSVSWNINSSVITPPLVHSGANAAYMTVDNTNIGTGNTALDFLVSPAVTVPVNGQLEFWTRAFQAGSQGTLYRIMIAPYGSDRMDPNSYTLLTEYTEAQLAATFNIYEQKVIPLSAFVGTDIYIAFVMVKTQPTSTTAVSDRWLVDDVKVVEKCIDPTTLTVLTPSITSNSANLSWNPNGTTSWEIEVVQSPNAPTGVGTLYTGALPYPATGLLPNTTYTYYVRAVCANSNSAWVGPSASFTTALAPPGCGGNYVDTGGVAGNYANNANTSITVTPPTPGDVATITFTAFNTELNNDVLRIYNGTSAIPANLIASYSGNAIPPPVTSSAPDGSLTFVFTSNATTTAAGWQSNITCGPALTCPKPIALGASAVLSTSANFAWTATGSATTWQVLALPCTSPAPTAATTGFISTTTSSYSFASLTPATCYNLYVRSDCGTETSEWAGPIQITTQAAPPVCNGNYIDAGGLAANYSNNTTAATGTTTIIPGTPGDVVTVTFTSFNTELNNDVLKVYNGSVVSAANLIGTYSGTTLPPVFTSSAADGALTFVFTSNATITAAGWVANITCGPPPPCATPIALTTTALTATSVDLGWTPTGTATTWQVIALPCTDPAPTAATTGWASTITNPVTISGLTPISCYKLYVRSDCGAGGVSPWSAPIQINTPAAPPVCNGNYLDPGGLTANYANNVTAATGTTTIIPGTPGDAVTVTFTSFNTELNNDVLSVYNGSVVSAANLIATYSGTTIPPAITSSAADGALTFVFTSNATVTAAGWVANVTCGPPVACPTPIALSTSGLLPDGVTLTWTPTGSATAWQVLALPCTDPAPTATTGGWISTSVGSPYAFTGLTPTTCYKLYVRSDCGAGVTSEWAGPIQITTTCSLFTPYFQEGFNTGSTSEQCWTVINGNNDADAWDMNYATNPFEGNQAAMMYTDFNAGANNDWLISPQIVLNGNQRLKFHYRVQSATEPNDMEVLLSHNGPVPAQFTTTLIPTTSYNNTTYQQRIVSLVGITGPVNIAFHIPAGGLDGWRMYIDNVIVEDLPTCPEPTALAVNTTTNPITATTAQIGWTNGNTETAWQVYAVTCGSAAPTATTTTGVIDVTTNPYTITGLTPSTCYDVYVRAVCSTTDSSVWTGPISFTTPIAPPVCGGIFYDSGGPNAIYQNNEDITTQICAGPGEVVTVTFTSFNTEATWDGLYVFDGNSVTSPQIASANPAGNVPGGLAGSYWGNLTGANLPGPFTSSTAGGCLTFRFRTDGSGTRDGWVANVSCSPAPNCNKPNTLTATAITSSSAFLGWNEPDAGVTQWEIFIVPTGQAGPLPTDSGTVVNANPALWTGLAPGTQYTYYVRAVCPIGGTSLWSSGYNFTTLIVNDDCSGAIFAPVNSSSVCQQTTPGTITGATASVPAPVAPCVGNANDDVWFQFVASNPYLLVSLQNVVGSTTNLNFGVYSGSCGTLTQIFCSAANTLSGTANGLTIGQTYYVRVYSNEATAQTVNFNLCISTPSSCVTGTSACQNLQYQNTTGVASQGTIGCLGSSPNPTYYTINVTQTGAINLLLTQSTTPGGPPNLDVDYAAWGPYTDQSSACTAIGNPPTLAPGIGVPVTQTTGCSFSAAATETLNIANAVAGQVYVILITNYSNNPGFISLTQTNFGTGGVYECCPDAYFTYNPVTYCKYPGATNPVATITTGSVAGTFSLSPASPPGLVFANTATGEVDLAASAPGNYLVLNTVAQTTTCLPKERGYNISIVQPTSATIAYASATYCQNITAPQPVIFTGDAGGTYAVSPNGGLYIDANTGAITPNLSAPGIYTVSYNLPGSSVCVGANPTTTVEILPLPAIVQPQPVVACDSYTLPALTVGNYFTGTGGTGTPLNAGDIITTTQTLYIYGVTPQGCSKEVSFTITINTVPAPTVTVVDASCATPTGTITVTAPVSASGSTPTDLFISEVTDEDVGSLTYIEIYNGTGVTKNLSNYKLKVYNNGNSTTSCDNALSGSLPNNTTWVVAVGSTTNVGGVVPNQVFAACGGVNNNDNIRLTTNTNVEIDLWGKTDGSTFTPAGQPGYTYRRLASAPHPSLVWNAADWTAIDPQDYTNVGTYSYLTSNYEYALDTNPYQTGTVFSGVVPGPHTITAHDLVTGCYSQPTPVTITLVGGGNITSLTPVATPICSGGDAVFTMTGTAGATVTYTINSGAPQTIVLDASGNATVTIPAVTADTTIVLTQITTATCSAAINNTATVVVVSNPSVTNLTAATPVCSGADAVFTLTGTANTTVTYTINSGAAQTVTLDATGNATVTITGVTADTTILLSQISLGTCTATVTNTATVVVLPNAVFGTLTAATPVCSGGDAVFTLTGTANATVSYTINSGATQTVTLDAAGNATVTINAVTADTTILLSQISLGAASCSATLTNTATVVVVSNPSVTGLTAATPVCSGADAVFTLTGTANTTVTYTINSGAAQTVTLDATGNATVTVNGVTADTTILLSQIDLGTCSATLTNTATVVVNANPALTNLTAATPVCSGADAVFTLTGTANATVTYTINSGAAQTVTLDAAGNATVTINAVTANTTITLSQIDLGSCFATLTNTATVVVNQIPTFTSLTAATPICSGSNAVFTLTGTANATVTYTINSGAAQTVTLNATGNATVTVNGVTADTTMLLSQIATGACNAALSNTATVVVNANPAFTNVTAATPVCSGADAVFTLTGTANATVTYDIDNGADQTVVLDAAGSATITITNVTSDTVISVSQITLGTCSVTLTNTATVAVATPLAILADGTCQGTFFDVTVTPATTGTTFDPAATFSWTNSSGQNVGNTQTIHALTADTYTVTVTINGCSSTQQVVVGTADLNCVIQRGISVNGDNLNDAFDLSGYSVKKITIFNRYGMEVYSKNDYTNQWKGESKDGDKLPDGTYYYVFVRANGETRTGWIYINREQ